MALIPIPGWAGSSYLSRAKGVSATRTVNFRVEKTMDPAGTPFAPVPIAKAPYVMYPRSGKKKFANMPIGPTVGCWSNVDSVYVAAGGNIYQLFDDATTNLLGPVQVGSRPVTFRSNRNQLLVCSGGAVYISTGTQFYQPIVNYGSGSVDVTGVDVTWQSGDLFTVAGGGVNIQPGDYFMLDGDLLVVFTVTDATHLVLTTDAGSLTGISFQVGQELLTGAMCEFIDGYFIVNIPNTNEFRISNLNDGKKWDAVDIAAKSGSTDNIAAIASVGGNLMLLGDTNSTEIWGESGNADFPFQRITGATLSIGTGAPWSIGKMPDGSIIVLLVCDGGEGMLVQTGGGQPARVSNYYFEDAVRKYGQLSDAVASTYLENGHALYRIDFPSANRTWEYDGNTQTLVELGVETDQDEVYGCDLARYTCYIRWPNGKRMQLGFDYKSDKVYEISPDFLDDDGVDFPVMRVSPHVNTNLAYTQCSCFALDCALGTIDPTLKGPDGKELIPTVEMFYSDDGGKTWTDAGAASLGRVGEYGGTELTAAESFDTTSQSQTNPQVFETLPMWTQLGIFWISKTFKVKSTGKMLRSVYNGLVELSAQ